MENIVDIHEKLSILKSLIIATITREQIDKELQKGIDSIKAGKIYSADEVDAVLEEEFDI